MAHIASLFKIHAPRHDAEGADAVDVEATSSTVWKRWKDSLSEVERCALMHWRGGAVAAPARQQRHSSRSTDCPYCGEAMASARHLWADCSRFADDRARLAAEFGLEAGWWAQQPRVTAKSGWITDKAALSPGGRGKAMVAANALGIIVVRACWAHHEVVAAVPSRVAQRIGRPP